MKGGTGGPGIMAWSTVKGKKNELIWEGQMPGSVPHCEIVWRFKPYGLSGGLLPYPSIISCCKREELYH